MRLAIFTNQFPGRASTFFARDIRGLLECGIEVDVYAIYPLEIELWSYVPNILNESILPRSRVHHISLAQSLRAIRPLPLVKFATLLRDAATIFSSAGQFGVEPLLKTAYVIVKAWAWSQRLHHRYDHILGYWGNYAATCAYVYHRLTEVRVPFSIFFHAGLDLYRDALYMHQKLLYADNIITCSEFNRDFISDHFPDIFHSVRDKLYIHHHGLDFGELPYEPDGRAPCRVIAVGRLEKYKGFDYLLRATNELKHRGIDIEVEFIGNGRQAHALRTLAHELRIMDRVKFRGWLHSDDVPKAMRQATILVHPSPDLGDGVPNVLKEAMAVGTPVVASSVAGIPEVLGHGRYGVLVPPKESKALAEAIETLLANEAMRRKFTDAAREYAEKKFDLWRNGQSLADLLRSTTRLNLIK